MADTTQRYHLANLDCANCAARIETALQDTPGVRFVSVDFATTTLYLDAEDLEPVRSVVQRIEPQVQIQPKTEAGLDDGFNTWRRLLPILISIVLFFGGLLALPWLEQLPGKWGLWLVLGSAYLISGHGVLLNALRNILHGQVFDEQFLMSVATLGAVAIGELPEAVGVMLFYQVGEYVQDLSVHRSRRSIQALLQVRPDQANLLVAGEVRPVSPQAVAVGATILVKPGEKVPLDGQVLSGSSQLDTSALTGESRPRRVEPEQTVLAGMVNLSGLLTIQVIRPFTQSSIARILELVEQASSRKAATERFITRFARIYSPLVVAVAAAVALLPPLLTGASFTEWIYRALVVLVISCPCALVISIPLGYFGGVGGASRRGILVKGSNFLDVLAAVKTVVFDKTGTLTQGVFEVTQIVPHNGYERTELLRLAAQAESGSNHPIAQSIRAAYGAPVDVVQDYQEIAGYGVQAVVAGQELIAGSDRFLHYHNIDHDMECCEVGGTVVHVAVDRTYAGYLVVSDRLKDDAVQTISALRAAGVERIIMLTGDQPEVAQQVADVLAVDEFRAGLLPEDKVAAMETIMAQAVGQGRVAFVGDGINDAPVLARADVGIAMGALGSEAAIEVADVVLMTDSPAQVVDAIRLGRRTRRIVWQNIILAMVVKALFILLGVFGLANMWMAVIGDMGVALLAVLNATRVLRVARD